MISQAFLVSTRYWHWYRGDLKWCLFWVLCMSLQACVSVLRAGGTHASIHWFSCVDLIPELPLQCSTELMRFVLPCMHCMYMNLLTSVCTRSSACDWMHSCINSLSFPSKKKKAINSRALHLNWAMSWWVLLKQATQYHSSNNAAVPNRDLRVNLGVPALTYIWTYEWNSTARGPTARENKTTCSVA